MKKKRNLLKYLLFLAPVILFACKESIVETTPELLDPEIEAMKKVLVENGFPEDLIVYQGEYFVVDQDIIITKEHVNAFSKKSSSPGTLHQRQAHGLSGQIDLVSRQNVSHITVAPQSDVPNDWKTALQNAINNWNATPSLVNFVYQATPDDEEDVLVKLFDLENCDSLLYPICAKNWFWAQAMPPSNDKPGSLILIDLDFTPKANLPSQKEEIMTHELGHIIGLRHTDWASRGETSAFTIPYTPSSDANSVMNSGTGGLRSWNGFSYYDEVAVRVLYPTSLSQPTVIVQSSSVNGFFLNVNLSLSYGWGTQLTIESKENSGSWQFEATVNQPVTSKSLVLPITGTSGTYYFRIKSKSYHGNIYSPYSNIEAVPYQAVGGGIGF